MKIKEGYEGMVLAFVMLLVSLLLVLVVKLALG
jgi:hypothetical protein